MEPHAKPMIRGEHVYLRASEREDIPTFVRWLNDAEVTRNLMARAPMSRAAEEGWFERMLAAQGKDLYHFVICLLEDGRPIGTAGLHEVDLVNGTAEFGIAIGERDCWDRGYGTDALCAISDFAFGELRLERLYLFMYAGNGRARRSYQKAGFVHEGTMRRAHFARGEREDVEFMGLLREEWAALDRRRSWDFD